MIIWWVAAVAGVGTALVLGELLLGLVVVRHSRDRASSRILGASLLLHAVTMGVVPVGFLLFALGFGNDEVMGPVALLTLAAWTGFLPALDIAFAMTFPTPIRPVARWPWLLVLPFVPAVASAAYVVQRLVANARGPAFVDRSGDINPSWLLFIPAFTFVAAVLASVIFWTRARKAATRLQRRRIRYMLWAAALPMAVLSGAALGIGLAFFFGVLPESDPVGYVAVGVPILILVLPPLAWGFGVLRYDIVDIQRRLFRLTSGSVAGLLVVGVFVAVTQLVEQLVQTSVPSAVFGFAAAFAIGIFFETLQRRIGWGLRRVVPGSATDSRDERERRVQLYRAAFEDASTDGIVSLRERRLLAALASSLGLGSSLVREVELAVRRERQAAMPRAPPREVRATVKSG